MTIIDLTQGVTREEFLTTLRAWGFTDEGWIDDKGNFWPCDMHMVHGYVARQVLGMSSDEDAEKEADKRGWVRLSDYGDRTCAKCLNQKQLNTLWDYCQHHRSCYADALKGIQFL